MQEPSMEIDSEFSLEGISNLDVMNDSISCSTLSLHDDPTLDFAFQHRIIGITRIGLSSRAQRPI